MPNRILTGICAFMLLSSCATIRKAQEIPAGTPQEKVEERLGKPDKVETDGSKEIWSYGTNLPPLLEASSFQVVMREGRYSHARPLKPDAFVRMYIQGLKGDTEPKKRTAILMPGSKEIAANDLGYIEFKRVVKAALERRGYLVTENPKEADTAILVRYGISDPQVQRYRYTEPVFGMVSSGGTATYSSQTNSNYSGNINGRHTYGGGSNSTTNGRVYVPPQYGVVGTREREVVNVSYVRWVALDAYDYELFRKSKAEKKFWSTSVTSAGPSDDLRFVFPYLLAGSMDYLGESTGNELLVIVDREDLLVDVLRGNGQDRLPASVRK